MNFCTGKWPRFTVLLLAPLSYASYIITFTRMFCALISHSHPSSSDSGLKNCISNSFTAVRMTILKNEKYFSNTITISCPVSYSTTSLISKLSLRVSSIISVFLESWKQVFIIYWNSFCSSLICIFFTELSLEDKNINIWEEQMVVSFYCAWLTKVLCRNLPVDSVVCKTEALTVQISL